MKRRHALRHWILFLFLFFCADVAIAATIHVDATAEVGGDGSEASPYQRIQQGINTAVAGDTVQVHPGTYTENIIMKEGITLLGQFLDSPIIQGQTAGPVVDATGLSAGTQIRFFDIKNGSSETVGGIDLRESSMAVDHCDFFYNVGDIGGAILISGDTAAPLIDGCYFYGNSSRVGGAVSVMNGAEPIFENCCFSTNHASFGGAVALWQTGSAGSRLETQFERCYFTKNSARYNGGAVYQLVDSTSQYTISAVYDRCQLYEHQALSHGGAIFAGDNVYQRFSQCVFRFNEAENDVGGNALYARLATTRIYNSVFYANTSETGGVGIATPDRTTGVFGIPAMTGSFYSYNSIFFQNGDSEFSLDEHPIFSGLTVRNCLVSGGWGDSLDEDPQFVDLENGDLHLSETSPCIDAGVNYFVADTDFRGDERVVDGDADGIATVDLGIYEVQRPNTVVVSRSWSSASIGDRVGERYIYGTDAFSTIQDGIDAVAGPGRVIVYGGNYYEHLTLKTNVMVEGRWGDTVNVFGSGSAQHLVAINGCDTGDTGIAGLTLQDGHDDYAAVFVNDSDVIIRNCDIMDFGAGIYMLNSTGEIDRCDVRYNGTGIHNLQSDPAITHCYIHENTIRGMENDTSSPRIDNTTMAYHIAETTLNGAAMYNFASNPEIVDCDFIGNRVNAEEMGGAIYNFHSSPMIRTSEFQGNEAVRGGAVCNTDYSQPQFDHCEFFYNDAEYGGAVYNYQVSPTFDGCFFRDNRATSGGGAFNAETGANPVFSNCVFVGNEATGNGAGVYVSQMSVPRMVHCVFYGNTADGNGGGIYANYSQPWLINSIVWDNSPNQLDGSSGEVSARNSAIQGGYGSAADMNIDDDPLFVAPLYHDFELDPASPCIDTGTEDGGIGIDYTYAIRPQGAAPDMGIYEYAGTPVLLVNPDPVDFGEVVTGETKGMKLTLENGGVEDLVITDAAIASRTHFSFQFPPSLPITLGRGESSVIMLEFAPGSVTGVITDSLTITSNSEKGAVAVTLMGMGIVQPFYIAATAGEGGSIDPSGSVLVEPGSDHTVTISADTGYEISDVLVDESSIGATDSHTFSAVDADHLIEAVFAPITYTITATAADGGAISPDGDVTVSYGGSQTFSITPDSGYIISDVVVDGTSVGAVAGHTFSDVTADHTISVTFDTPHYFITATAGSGGSISPSGSIRVEEGATQTFTITADEWLDVSDVLGDGVSIGAVSSHTFTDVDADHTIEAVFVDLVPDVWVDDDYSAGGDNDGHTWMVDAFNMVQDGIDAVSAPAVVHVAPGTYNEQVALKSGVQVLGSDPETTILDVAGLAGDGIVVTALDVDSAATLAGFTIVNGRRTTSTTFGRGMNLTNSNPVIRDCIFEANQSVALQNDNSSPQISDCIFRNNEGGGMRNINGSNPVLNNCRFEANDTYGMENIDSSPELAYCDFIGNYVVEAVSPSGGGMYNNNGNPRVVDCRFIDNRLDTAVDFKGGGGGMYNANNSSPEILRCEFTGNAAAKGGAIYNSSSSPTISECTFTNNEGDVHDDDQGGAIHSGAGSAPTIANCVFTGNSGYRGGAIYFNLGTDQATPATVTNCIFNGNTALRNGGAIYAGFDGTALHIVNAVFYNNEPDSDSDGFGLGGALYNDRADVTLINTIAWNNDSSEIETNVAVVVQYSDIEGGYGLVADMNIDADPMFMDAAAGNFRLQTGSPCIDTGTSTGSITLPTADIEGTLRPVGVRHDMGVYEYAAGQDIDISMTSVDFGTVIVGATGSQDISITNTGDVDLTISNVALSDDTHYAFTFAPLPATVAPGEAVTLAVAYTPTSAEQHDADLTITSNDPDESPVAISLTGIGLPLTHTISASAGSGGSITPSGSIEVVDGEDQSFTIAAGDGYTIANILVDGVSMGAASTYAFSDVTADHTIEAQFALPASIIVGAVSGDIGEDGATATFTVGLSSQPSDTVEIPIDIDDASEASLSADSITFSTSNWSTPQTITITGINDDVDDGDQTVTVTIGPAESTDTDYHGADPDDLSVVNVDDDTAGIIVGTVSGDTDEGGATVAFTVVLASEPTADVEISVAGDDGTEADVSPVALIFTAANWRTPQTITVTGIDDDEVDGDVSYAILLAAISSDTDYDGMNPSDIILINLDDDATTPADTGDTDDGGGDGGGGGGCFINSL